MRYTAGRWQGACFLGTYSWDRCDRSSRIRNVTYARFLPVGEGQRRDLG